MIQGSAISSFSWQVMFFLDQFSDLPYSLAQHKVVLPKARWWWDAVQKGEQVSILLNSILLFCSDVHTLLLDTGHLQFCLERPGTVKSTGKMTIRLCSFRCSGCSPEPEMGTWLSFLGWFMLSQRVFCGDMMYNRLGGGWVQCFAKRSPVSQFVLCLNTAKASENNSGS